MKSLLNKIIIALFLVVGSYGVASVVNTGRSLADPQPLQQAENSTSSTSTTSTDTCNNTTTSDSLKKCVQNNGITKDLQLIVNVLSAGVGIVVIAMIILGGIQYSIAGDNAQAVSAAKQRITNALLALFAYLFIFAFLQWLIPGGLFG